MSCVDGVGNRSKAPVDKVGRASEESNSKPCIDFQPDDRWGIKDEAVPKSKTVNCSNGRSLRSRSRSSQNNTESSPAVNGESKKFDSDNDSQSASGKTITKLKRNLSETESNDIKDSDEPTNKKMKVSKEVVSDIEMEEINSADDSNSKGDAASPGSKSDEQNDKEDLDTSIVVLESNESEIVQNSEDSSKDNDCEVVSSSESSKHKNDIEVINIPDDRKSDEESDSEIQIINEEEVDSTTKDFPNSGNAEDFPSRGKVEDFPSRGNAEDFPSNGKVSSADTDVRLTAGYPYYNSLKEKIDSFKAGEYKPVKFPHTGTLYLGDKEVIIESPSLLVPLLIKEADEFPKPASEVKKENGEGGFMIRSSMISRKNFFQSSVGQFLINLGTSRVQEWYHRDMKRAKLKQKKSNKPTQEDLEKAVAFHEKRHDELKEVNAVFNFRMRQCKFCSFKTESVYVLDGHYLTPHLSTRREYSCNFCKFLTRDTEAIVFHYEAMHGRKAFLDVDMPFHECVFCSFSNPLKTKVTGHMNKCRKHFIPSQNLAPPFDFEFPGVTTKPVTLADVVGHKRLLMNSAKSRLPTPEDNSAYARKKLASVLSKLSGQSTYINDGKNPSLMKQLMSSQPHLPLSGSSLQLPPGIVITRPRGQPIQQMRPMGSRFSNPRMQVRTQSRPGRPPLNTSITASQLASSGISITPVSRGSVLPRVNNVSGIRNVTLTPIGTNANRSASPKPVALFTSMAGSSGLLGQPQAKLSGNMNVRPPRPAAPYQRLNTPPSQVVKGSSGNTFVVCEICDSYIKDLEELRTHMNWVHKVKIHPKMLVSRPPLNCQKCQWRFFTDQGLERHLLGAHGLVTTNMQEMANKNQDGGRCIICGAVFTYKLVSHMTQVHKVTLKPAHLSYKCTVCTATFTLYRLFESHVYNVHSGSAKRSAEDSSSEPPAKKSVTECVGARRCKDCRIITDNMQDHIIKKHIKDAAVKLCRIEKCKKCLYSSDEFLLIRMSDFGLEDEDDSAEESDSSDESSEAGEGKETG